MDSKKYREAIKFLNNQRKKKIVISSQVEQRIKETYRMILNKDVQNK